MTDLSKRIDIERITHAAVFTKEGYPIMGKSHADCFHLAKNTGIEMSQRAAHQGFMTSNGRYVERPEAAKIAIEAGQVRADCKILFSEDLWSKHSGGWYEYDSVKGYY